MHQLVCVVRRAAWRETQSTRSVCAYTKKKINGLNEFSTSHHQKCVITTTGKPFLFNTQREIQKAQKRKERLFVQSKWRKCRLKGHKLSLPITVGF